MALRSIILAGILAGLIRTSVDALPSTSSSKATTSGFAVNIPISTSRKRPRGCWRRSRSAGWVVAATAARPTNAIQAASAGSFVTSSEEGAWGRQGTAKARPRGTSGQAVMNPRFFRPSNALPPHNSCMLHSSSSMIVVVEVVCSCMPFPPDPEDNSSIIVSAVEPIANTERCYDSSSGATFTQRIICCACKPILSLAGACLGRIRQANLTGYVQHYYDTDCCNTRTVVL